MRAASAGLAGEPNEASKRGEVNCSMPAVFLFRKERRQHAHLLSVPLKAELYLRGVGWDGDEEGMGMGMGWGGEAWGG